MERAAASQLSSRRTAGDQAGKFVLARRGVRLRRKSSLQMPWRGEAIRLGEEANQHNQRWCDAGHRDTLLNSIAL